MNLPLLPPLLFLLLLLPSLTLSATFNTSSDSSSGTISFSFLCSDDTDAPLGPSPILTTTFSPDVSFQEPAVSSSVGFEYVSGGFPFSMEIEYSCVSEKGGGCWDPDVTMVFGSAEELDEFVYEPAFLPGSCSKLTGPSIRCQVSFCAKESTDITFTSSFESLAQESLFPSGEEIPLPGPKVAVGDEMDESVLQVFTFELSKDQGTFTLDLENGAPINESFSAIAVNGETLNLDFVTSSSYSVTVKEESFFSLLEANTTTTVAGNVTFSESNDDDFPIVWVVAGSVGGVFLLLGAVLLVHFTLCKSPPDYEEVA